MDCHTCQSSYGSPLTKIVPGTGGDVSTRRNPCTWNTPTTSRACPAATSTTWSAGVPRFTTSPKDTVYVPGGTFTHVRAHSSRTMPFTEIADGAPAPGSVLRAVVTRSIPYVAGSGPGAAGAGEGSPSTPGRCSAVTPA